MNLRSHPSPSPRSWRRRGAAASAGTVLALLAGLIPAGVASVAAAAAFANRHRQAAAGVTFTDADPAGNLSQYAGSINWGDGTTTTIPKSHFIAIPARLGGGFAAGDVHTYAHGGTYTVTITINDSGGAFTSASTTLKVPRH